MLHLPDILCDLAEMSLDRRGQAIVAIATPTSSLFTMGSEKKVLGLINFKMP